METTLHRRRSLIALGVALVLVYILWNTPALSPLLYPFRLFVTFVHEAGHGLAAMVSGGRFVGFVVEANGTGVATTVGGSRALILPAGYLGAALFGALLFYFTNTVPFPRTISVLLGAVVVVIAVVFGGVFSVATLVGVMMGAALIAIGWRADRSVNLLALNLLAILTALNAVLDLVFLTQYSGATLGDVRNDALAFSQEIAPLIPAPLIAAAWAVLALAMLGAAVWYSLVRRRRETP